MKIEAFAVRESGEKPEPFTYEKKVGKNDILIKISHCSLTAGDVQMMNNAWGDSKFPLVAGHEVIGVVERIGSNVGDLKIGDRVGVGYQLEACFKCDSCKEGNEQFCTKQKVVAVDYYGGLAKHIIVDRRFAFKISRKLDPATTAPLLSSGLTVYSAIVTGNLSKKSKTAVLGIGGLGHLAIQFLHKMGHEVSAFSRSHDKRAMIEKLGGKFIDSSNANENPDLIGKFDFILSTLNVDFDFNAYLKMLKPQGKFCVVAQPPNRIPLNAGLLYDYAQRTIYGNYTGSRKNMATMLAFASRHDIKSIVDVMPFSKLDEAIDHVASGKIPMRLILENKD